MRCTNKPLLTRRQFLAAAAATTLSAYLKSRGQCVTPEVKPQLPPYEERKLIVILFGGGTRSSESMDDPEHRYIPRLWNEMVPKGTLFTNMRVEHKVVHPNSAGSIMTGHWEWDDIDWSKPVAHPTMFEIYRKVRKTPDISTWAFVYASILANTGESMASGYGAKYGANVVEPPTIPRSTAEKMDRLMSEAARQGTNEGEAAAAVACSRLARETSRIRTTGIRSGEAKTFLDEQYSLWKNSNGTTSHDAFLTDRAIACMQRFAPEVISIDYGEIDCAHYGSWSRYVEAIRRTDELTWRIRQATEELEAYRGKTLLLILPDHGRELDRDGKWGFIHHSNFYTNEGADEGCRRVWMLALGPGVKANHVIEAPTPITSACATGLEYLGLTTTRNSAKSIWNLIS